jgi:probable F420-dependent oxidoreductase
MLMTYLVVLPYRNPFLLAKTASTLDALSGGRLVLGLGTGYLKSEFFSLGVNYEERNALFDEALDVLKLIWTGEPVTYKGLHFSAKAVTSQPRPIQRPHPPLWLGGNSKLTLRRVAQKAQGWLAMPNRPESAKVTKSPALDITGLEEQIVELRANAKAAGRIDGVIVHYPLQEGHEVRPTAEVAATAQRLAAMGVDWVTWKSFTDSVPAMVDDIRRFGDEVIAKVS